jgi:hypothetical protein
LSCKACEWQENCDVHETIESIDGIRKSLEEQSEMQTELLNRLADSAESIAAALQAVVTLMDLGL